MHSMSNGLRSSHRPDCTPARAGHIWAALEAAWSPRMPPFRVILTPGGAVRARRVTSSGRRGGTSRLACGERPAMTASLACTTTWDAPALEHADTNASSLQYKSSTSASEHSGGRIQNEVVISTYNFWPDTIKLQRICAFDKHYARGSDFCPYHLLTGRPLDALQRQDGTSQTLVWRRQSQRRWTRHTWLPNKGPASSLHHTGHPLSLQLGSRSSDSPDNRHIYTSFIAYRKRKS